MSFNFIRDSGGLNTYGLEFLPKTLKYSMTLSAGVEAVLSVPNGYNQYFVIFAFSPGGSVWVAINDTAEIPIGVPAQTSSELNPVARLVRSGDTISFVAQGTAVSCNVLFYPKE